MSTTALAEEDAEALMRILMRRGLVAGDPGRLPPQQCDATPLDAMQQVIAPVAGLVVYRARLGAQVEAGAVVAEIVDPLGGSVPVKARTDGVLFARHDQPFAWPGKVIGKIAGAVPLPERTRQAPDRLSASAAPRRLDRRDVDLDALSIIA